MSMSEVQEAAEVITGAVSPDANIIFGASIRPELEDEIIVTGGNQCMIITKKGRVKFRYSFSDVVRNMIPTSKSNEYIVTFEGKTERISLRMEDK